MDWDKLRIFHAVAAAGSFTHAGEELHLSQSAVSRQIANLEHEVKTKLFLRHARGLKLTEQGEMLYRTAHDVFSKLKMAENMLKDSTEKPFGDLTITTTEGLGANWLTPRLNEFMHQYPEINLKIILGDRDVDLGLREADLAIRLHQPTQQDLIARKLFTVHFHVFASPDYLAEYGTPQTIEDLDKHKILTYGSNAPTYYKNINWLETLGRDSRTPREAHLSMNSVYGLKRACMYGIGLAALPDYIVDDANLIPILPDIEPPEFDTYLVFPEELRNSKRVAVFKDFLVSKAKEWNF
ncbi:MAG: LysR family transcriptional regulator [Hyphomicrobiales bacterium]|nr:MAG: LysR family transcriptional regulator [Hyphomicrobiales bacterium]